MKNLPTYQQYILEKTSGEVLKPKRNKPVKFDMKNHPELADEFFELIRTAYSSIGGHAKIQTPEDLVKNNKWDWWEGEDIHGTPDFDLIIFGTKTKFGVKFAGVGHDGTSNSKRTYIQKRAKDLMKPGYFIEVSGRIAEILINDYRIPQVEDQDTVERVLGKSVEWKGKSPESPNIPGNSWYMRLIGGKPFYKILLGKPKV